MPRNLKCALPALLLALAASLSACSSSPSNGTGAASAKSTTTTTAQVIVSSSVTIDGKSVVVPTEDGKDPIKPFGDTGQQIILTSTGVLPRSLYSSLHQPVVWTNLTSQPVTLTIEHVGLAPVTVQPGATYSWTPNVLSFGYTSSAGGSGYVYPGAFGQQ